MNRICLKICGVLLLVSGIRAGEPPRFFDAVGDFFAKYVKTGGVAYREIHHDPAEIMALCNEIAAFRVDFLGDHQVLKAFWLNAYNVLVIKEVIENYPIPSPQSVAGFFDGKKYLVAGEWLTLDELEKERLFKQFRDPRMHFALVCAARSCPPLMRGGYRPGVLEQQLNDITPRALNDPAFVRVDTVRKKVIVSHIFQWYASDFSEAAGSITAFINQYRNKPLPPDFTLEYMPYDWRLNDSPDSNRALPSAPATRLRAYTPSTLLKKGELEIKHFNNLYTQTAFYDANYNKISQGNRSTFFTSFISLLYGEKSNLNIGLDLLIKAVRNDREGSSPFALFRFANDANGRIALTHAAPKIKIIPFRFAPRLALQTSLLFPLPKDLDGANNPTKPFLDVDGFQWWLQLLWDDPLHRNWLVYLETGTFIRFGVDFFTPIKVLLNYYPAGRWTIYAAGEVSPFWGSEGLAALFAQGGMGIKYEISRLVEVEMLFTQFLIGKNQGAGQTYNFGWRFVR